MYKFNVGASVVARGFIEIGRNIIPSNLTIRYLTYQDIQYDVYTQEDGDRYKVVFNLGAVPSGIRVGTEVILSDAPLSDSVEGPTKHKTKLRNQFFTDETRIYLEKITYFDNNGSFSSNNDYGPITHVEVDGKGYRVKFVNLTYSTANYDFIDERPTKNLPRGYEVFIYEEKNEISTEIIEEREDINFSEISRTDSSEYTDYRKVTGGINGYVVREFKQVKKSGVLIYKEFIRVVDFRQKEDRVTVTGTKPILTTETKYEYEDVPQPEDEVIEDSSKPVGTPDFIQRQGRKGRIKKTYLETYRKGVLDSRILQKTETEVEAQSKITIRYTGKIVESRRTERVRIEIPIPQEVRRTRDDWYTDRVEVTPGSKGHYYEEWEIITYVGGHIERNKINDNVDRVEAVAPTRTVGTKEIITYKIKVEVERIPIPEDPEIRLNPDKYLIEEDEVFFAGEVGTISRTYRERYEKGVYKDRVLQDTQRVEPKKKILIRGTKKPDHIFRRYKFEYEDGTVEHVGCELLPKDGRDGRIFEGSTAPLDTKLLWRDTSDNKLKYFNSTSSTWESLDKEALEHVENLSQRVEASIENKGNEILSTVRSSYYLKKDIDTLIQEQESKIQQTDSKISLSVRKDDLISEINTQAGRIILKSSYGSRSSKIVLTDEGTEIERGIIKTAHIADASITSAKIQSLSADKIDVGVINGRNAEWNLYNGDFRNGPSLGQNVKLENGSVSLYNGSEKKAAFERDGITVYRSYSSSGYLSVSTWASSNRDNFRVAHEDGTSMTLSFKQLSGSFYQPYIIFDKYNSSQVLKNPEYPIEFQQDTNFFSKVLFSDSINFKSGFQLYELNYNGKPAITLRINNSGLGITEDGIYYVSRGVWRKIS